MRKMKDSGIPWIGLYPEHWENKRGKHILRLLQKPVNKGDGVITCFRDGEVTLRSNRREEGFTIAEKECGYQGVDIGDLVVHGMDGFAGAIGISDSRGKASPVLNVLDSTLEKKYAMYYLRSMAYGNVFLALATGIRVRSCDLRWNKLSELRYPVPPYHEQQAIASFLDEKCQEIEALMEDIRAEISTLEEYKKSVITEAVTKECSPNVKRKEENPKCSCLSWKIQKLKYIAELNPKQYNQITVKDMVTFTPMENIKNGYYINKEKPYSLFIGNSQYSAYEEGDIVFAKVTPCFENGNIAIMEGLINKRGFGSSELFVIRPNKIEQKFLFYVLQNANFLNYGVSSMTGTGGLKRVSSYAVNNYTLALPETKEQKNIVSFLDKKCADINDCIERKRLQLATLAEYKKSLIYEYVTGKKEVPHK